MSDINELIARWNTDEGKPYKGSLIDRDSYTDGNLSCMCAQGQVLHVIGGWTADELTDAEQTHADKETAKLLNISRTHAILLRIVNDKRDGAPAIVLTNPGKVLGDQWSTVLDFWWHIDTLDADGWRKVSSAWDAAWDAAGTAALDAAWDAAWDVAWAVAWDAAGTAARDAAREIQGAEILKRDGKPFVFLPMFGFASPDEIPARPADYGVVK